MSITEQAKQAITELIETANLIEGDIVVVGCSSSEAAGHIIGTDSSLETAREIVNGIMPVIKEKKLFLAAQCCEHLNRALIIEKEAMLKYNYEQVNVLPQKKAGGSFATEVYSQMDNPVAVEYIVAKAGLDIGGTLIGMHLARVAVPVRLSINKIGEANILCARTRPKYIGGERAHYNERLM